MFPDFCGYISSKRGRELNQIIFLLWLCFVLTGLYSLNISSLEESGEKCFSIASGIYLMIFGRCLDLTCAYWIMLFGFRMDVLYLTGVTTLCFYV